MVALGLPRPSQQRETPQLLFRDHLAADNTLESFAVDA